MRLQDFAHHLLSHPAWLVCYLVVLAIISAVLVDIDHPLHYYLHWGEHGRFLMQYFAIAGAVLASGGVLILVSLVCRL